ncbi:MAG: hypothetical protein WD768_17635 [Phycisphaeraceae bacterium]
MEHCEETLVGAEQLSASFREDNTMIVRPCSSAHEGPPVQCQLDKRYADTPRGHAVLVLNGGLLVEPSFAALADYRIVEATDEERRQLKAAGYEMDDFVPPNAPTPARSPIPSGGKAKLDKAPDAGSRR